jgi:hypothetical protein
MATSPTMGAFSTVVGTSSGESVIVASGPNARTISVSAGSS